MPKLRPIRAFLGGPSSAKTGHARPADPTTGQVTNQRQFLPSPCLITSCQLGLFLFFFTLHAYLQVGTPLAHPTPAPSQDFCFPMQIEWTTAPFSNCSSLFSRLEQQLASPRIVQSHQPFLTVPYQLASCIPTPDGWLLFAWEEPFNQSKGIMRRASLSSQRAMKEI